MGVHGLAVASPVPRGRSRETIAMPGLGILGKRSFVYYSRNSLLSQLTSSRSVTHKICVEPGHVSCRAWPRELAQILSSCLPRTCLARVLDAAHHVIDAAVISNVRGL
jgi:hypothetical protein